MKSDVTFNVEFTIKELLELRVVLGKVSVESFKTLLKESDVAGLDIDFDIDIISELYNLTTVAYNMVCDD